MIAYNGSASSRLALKECMQLASSCKGASVHLLAVVHTMPMVVPGEFVAPEPTMMENQAETRVMQEVLESGRRLLAEAGLQVTAHLEQGEPVEVIAGLAARLAVELVIVGHSRHKPYSMRWWRRSTVDLLANGLHCGLLVVGHALPPLADLRRAPHAIDHRRIQQELAMTLLVRRCLPHLVQSLRPDFRIAFFQEFLVTDRDCLYVFDVGDTALSVIQVQHALVLTVLDHCNQLVDKVDCIMDAAVQAHSTERIVDMGGIARKHYPPDAERLRNPLMDTIDAAVRDIVFDIGR